MKRRTVTGYLAGGWWCGAAALAPRGAGAAAPRAPSVVISWNAALMAAIKATRTAPTIAARAIAMVYEAVYNAWSCYDSLAQPTLVGMFKRPAAEASDITRQIAVGHAAHNVLADLFPTQLALFEATLSATVPVDLGGRIEWNTARQVGLLAAASLLQVRHADGSNQLGDLAAGAYTDFTGYQAVNSPDLVVDATRWQPLRVANAQGTLSVQRFLTPHWGRVRPFALPDGSAFRPALGAAAPTVAELQEMLDLSASLTDQHKAIAEYWAGGPGTVTPPGMWTEIAEQAARRDANTLDQDVKMFFAVGQALLDASIAAWDAKRAFDSVRPITAVRTALAGQMIQSWGGPGAGTQWIRGEDWTPYQPATFPTPPFPEFVSGHSTFSGAAAEVLKRLRGDHLPMLVRLEAGSSEIEPMTPRRPVVLHWDALSDAAASAGLSRRYGGIHFTRGDMAGRALGREVGAAVLAKCDALFRGGLPQAAQRAPAGAQASTKARARP